MSETKISQEELNSQIAKATEAGKTALGSEPIAISARFDKKSNRIIVGLKSGISFMFPVQLAQGLADANASDLKEIEITPSGQGLYWPLLDVDLSIPHLLQGFFGTKKWMTRIFSEMGQTGGSRRTPAKMEASRINGKLGGRPRKKAS
ncbi:MAG: DUF2442 domain-containing protein [Candidatus Riflebacteria bacterium]|nr:DUF2442 domain-containing protein [Candidatus Riflebacteria bacterium]